MNRGLLIDRIPAGAKTWGLVCALALIAWLAASVECETASVDPQRLIVLNDCILEDGRIAADGEFLPYRDYFPRFSRAGFNAYRHNNCFLRIGTARDDRLLREIFSDLKASGWTTWAVLFQADSPEVAHTSLALERARVIVARYREVVDIWELVNEARPAVDWVRDVAEEVRRLDPGALITISWNDAVYIPYVDFNSPHAYLPLSAWNASQLVQEFIGRERAKDPSKPLVVGEFGRVPCNWEPDQAELAGAIARAFRAENVGWGLWLTNNTRSFCAPSANFYCGPEERAAILQALGGQSIVTPRPTPPRMGPQPSCRRTWWRPARC